ncbi:acetylglutamate kinase [Marinoscillum sp.]|uniref:acetylglutamate kinase n=1 Tax=Marinoscillum sp. TaxID=2024838 RepID=UPI003BAC9D28
MAKETLHIIKIGGAVIENPEMKQAFLNGFVALKGRKILIHGGGRIATEIGNKLGLVANMVEGRRVTDDATIDLVTMVYGGLVNKQLVAQLQSLGENAIGLTGADANLITSSKRPIKNDVDYGWVGDPQLVNDTFAKSLIEEGSIPVIAPLTHDGQGHILNTNADTMAGTMASAMAPHYEVNLILTFELDGVMKDVNDSKSLITNFEQSFFNEMKASGAIHSGMIPKLENAFKALESGVGSVRICKYDQIHTQNGSFLQV